MTTEFSIIITKIIYTVLALLLVLPVATTSFYKKANWKGILLCLCLAVLAWQLGTIFPMAGGPVIGILTGIIATNVWKKQDGFTAGIKASSKKMLQMAIVLFGFQMNLKYVIEMGFGAIALVLSVISASFLTAVVAGKILGMRYNEKVLVGTGTAICGGSAIAAVSPVIEADDKEVATAISTIFLFNIIAAFLFPVLGRLFNMSDTQFGMWAGTAINDTSSVVAAGYAFSDKAGEIATVVKLTRTIMIIPLTLILALIRAKTAGKQSQGVSITKTFPWFVLAFLLACIVNTTGIIPVGVSSYWSKMGKFLVVVAMVAIGFGCDFKELVKSGRKSVVLGFCCWLCVSLVSLFVLRYISI